MDPRESVKLAYDSIGSDFGKKRTDPWDFVIEWMEELKSKKSGKPLRLLVAGCGNGRHVRLANEMGFDVSAVDLSPSMVNATIQSEREAGRTGSKIFISDICDLPFSNNEFDAVISIAVLHHLPFGLSEIAMNEFSRVVDINGEILVSCWDKSAPSVISGNKDDEDPDVVWVSWTLPDKSTVLRYYHLPLIKDRMEHWGAIKNLICNHFELNNNNQLFYFSKIKSSR